MLITYKEYIVMLRIGAKYHKLIPIDEKKRKRKNLKWSKVAHVISRARENLMACLKPNLQSTQDLQH